MDAHPPEYKPPAGKAGEVTEYRDKLGRRRFRGYKRTHSEMRKVVPKRKWDLKTVEGLLKREAYRTDTTRKEFAKALGVTTHTFDKIIAPPNANKFNKIKLNRHHIDTMCDVMGIHDSKREGILRAYGRTQTKEKSPVETV